jgi:hypothetical protein
MANKEVDGSSIIEPWRLCTDFHGIVVAVGFLFLTSVLIAIRKVISDFLVRKAPGEKLRHLWYSGQQISQESECTATADLLGDVCRATRLQRTKLRSISASSKRSWSEEMPGRKLTCTAACSAMAHTIGKLPHDNLEETPHD